MKDSEPEISRWRRGLGLAEFWILLLLTSGSCAYGLWHLLVGLLR